MAEPAKYFGQQRMILPGIIPKEGFIHKDNNITIGIWIMPNNDLNAMLEDFITFLIPENHELLKIAEQTLETIEKKSLNQYLLVLKVKAKIHYWLSWKESQ